MNNKNGAADYRRAIPVILLILLSLTLSSCALFESTNKYVTHVRGRVTIEGITDYSGISVQVRYYDYGTRHYVILAAILTDSSGHFDMDYVPFVPDQVDFEVYATKGGYASSDEDFSIYYGYNGSPFVFNNMRLHRQKRMIFDWAWKNGDGSSFAGAETGRGTVYSYVVGTSKPVSYAFGAADTDYYSRIHFYDDDDQPTHVYTHRLWDLGNVALASVTSKPSTDTYSYRHTTMQVGHTYVVETATGYAKFHVISVVENAE